ncbi:hypothetical protein HNR00_003430 [Methylorubrum rhodinum]|jgi:hypothetical protein|uniref:Uncharacterized protein n=1 Tax=Methylorubrum rhodinum TaxID=29428 RepID=A0A840ZP88_9HYPH|nr:hypothetical protein [Methylorubrum rhodinum]MBB5758707.1 hypothetical protein [Methylorubrum rhodinum]
MSARTFCAPIAVLTLLAGLTAADAQVLGQGRNSGSSRMNQNFEVQNQNRNFQQRQTLENSAVRNQIQRAPLNRPAPSGPGLIPRP